MSDRCLSFLSTAVKLATVCIVAAASSMRTSQAQQMVFPGDTWPIATPESVLVDSEKLQAAVDNLAKTANSVDEMIILRNGRVVWQGSNVNYSQHVFSMTKSFTSTTMGLLVDDGKVAVDTPVKEFVPALVAEYPDATFRHFATHTSGYLASNERVPLSIARHHRTIPSILQRLCFSLRDRNSPTPALRWTCGPMR